MTFKIGQKVRIKVVKADPETREIDFELVAAEEVEKLQAPKANKRNNHQKNEANRRGKKQHNPEKKQGKRFEQTGKGKSKKAGKVKKKKPFYKGIKKK